MTKQKSNTAELADLVVAELSSAPPPAYRVLSPLFHGTTADDQRRYEPGETLALSSEQAAPLLACGAVEPLA